MCPPDWFDVVDVKNPYMGRGRFRQLLEGGAIRFDSGHVYELWLGSASSMLGQRARVHVLRQRHRSLQQEVEAPAGCADSLLRREFVAETGLLIETMVGAV